MLTLSEAARLFPRRHGKTLSLVAMRRRILRGEAGVRLRATRDGRQWFTSAEWVAEFAAEVTRRRLSQPIADRSDDYRTVLARLRARHGI